MKPFVIKLLLLAFVTMTIFSCSVDSELQDIADEIERQNNSLESELPTVKIKFENHSLNAEKRTS
ncbi:hypothetical protein D1013_00615 [Euzebyella marina]|uniref:Uncharacterized protein n=1 Tax=Euzebyella marina TaxID=1761453 RepID=A0A3G2L1A0_9FLAO|nr:hypothetical protein [Euzebyella marina]AYN65986.1 hypothetical protein D1013_00615 [Euzebyella marina]